MPKILQDTLKSQIDHYYDGIEELSSKREYAERLYGVIGIKKRNQQLARYGEPLYLDVKLFIAKYLTSFDSEDYGYDIPNNEKVVDAIDSLPLKEQLAMCLYADKVYEDCGYESSFLDKRINKLRMSIAWNERRYVAFLLRLSALNIWTLIGSYLLFLVVVYILLLPAPFEWMGVLQIEPHNFGLSPIKNQVMNTLALVSGGEFAPTITPSGFRGMLLFILGKITFYLLIGNFIVKKLADYFSFE